MMPRTLIMVRLCPLISSDLMHMLFLRTLHVYTGLCALHVCALYYVYYMSVHCKLILVCNLQQRSHLGIRLCVCVYEWQRNGSLSIVLCTSCVKCVKWTCVSFLSLWCVCQSMVA